MQADFGSQPNQSLIDGIAVLQALAISSEPVGCRELARRLNLEPTRVNRLLKTLAWLGFATQTVRRKYQPGPGMTVLAAQSLFASSLIRKALPSLGKLRRFGYTVAMGVLWRDNVSYIYHAPPGMSDADALGRIGLYPATSGGIGMVLLAALEERVVKSIYQGHEIPNYPNMKALLTDLADIRKKSYVRLRVKTDVEQHTVAIAVGNPVHSAIGVSGWIPVESTPTIVAALRETAQEIEQASQVSESDKDLLAPLLIRHAV
ncbi:IclR family transcriptional regulator [Peristeroidobacter soli]|uniref:IclR family transcriptional regulator n=1 Tax=Peristeroidobacter soli TaxID=2497877 RepID=UPI00101BA4F1|nr:helix-turn-helix domain-containing protein [Peristeroidobacter soli]